MGPDLVRDTPEKVELIRKRLLTSQSWQKSYADMIRVVRFNKRGKLSPRFIRHFEVLKRLGIVAYWLAL